MPKGPNGQKRPADAIGLAVMVGKIATGEIEDTATDPSKAHHTAGGKKGGAARAAKLTLGRLEALAAVAFLVVVHRQHHRVAEAGVMLVQQIHEPLPALADPHERNDGAQVFL